MVRVRHGRTEPAPDRWRWRQLQEHVWETADAEEEDGRADGPHQALEAEYMAVHEGGR
jgi:hypothetical protein